MTPPQPDPAGETDTHDALRRIEERVRQVQDLGPFEVHRREDGRFQCELEKPIRELTGSELRQVLATLESLADALRSRLEETEEG